MIKKTIDTNSINEVGLDLEKVKENRNGESIPTLFICDSSGNDSSNEAGAIEENSFTQS